MHWLQKLQRGFSSSRWRIIAAAPLVCALKEAMGKDIEDAILFADVVGSTQLYEQLGDAKAREMVGRCLDIMREATEANKGTVIKTMGDEVMSTFPTPDDAMNAAKRMQ